MITLYFFGTAITYMIIIGDQLSPCKPSSILFNFFQLHGGNLTDFFLCVVLFYILGPHKVDFD